jgi:hypothetical protein
MVLRDYAVLGDGRGVGNYHPSLMGTVDERAMIAPAIAEGAAFGRLFL